MKYIVLYLCLFLSFQMQAQRVVSLNDALSLAVKNNPFFLAEKLNVDQAKSALLTASLKPNPTLGISTIMIPSAKYYAPGTSLMSPDNRQMNYQLSQAVPWKGQYKNRVELAKSDVGMAGISLSASEWSLLNNVAISWLDLWYAGEKLKMIELAGVNADTLLNINQIRLRNQVITTTEFTRTQISTEQYRLMRMNALQEVKSRGSDLSLLLGLQDSLVLVQPEQWAPALLPENLDTLVKVAFKNRAEWISVQSQKDRANLDVKLQKSMATPQPEFGVSYSPQNNVPYLGLSLSFPLPVSDRNQGEIARAKISLDQANSLEIAIRQQILNQVKNAFSVYQTAKKSWERYSDLNAKSVSVLNSVKMSYLKGGTTILDYIEAERSWFEMQSQFYEAMYNYRKSYLDLLFTCNYSGK
ncbi:MAG: TolC family protein [Marinilabiliales bacterium]|nr:TolC family protein [Marinilabiliales bacterium]